MAMQLFIRKAATRCMALGADVLNKGGYISDEKTTKYKASFDKIHKWDENLLKSFVDDIFCEE
ncbi:MAG: hypothetical protein WCF65_01685 [Parachlamydiaceae bacterium]